MCNVCGAIVGHREGCPEAGDPPVQIVGECYWCGKGIDEGDTIYTDRDGNQYHEYCVESCAVDILEELFGFERGTA